MPADVGEGFLGDAQELQFSDRGKADERAGDIKVNPNAIIMAELADIISHGRDDGEGPGLGAELVNGFPDVLIGILDDFPDFTQFLDGPHGVLAGD